MTTLRELHEELNITQRLSLYIKNQNKKYKPNEPFTADKDLSKTMETLIRINTLGKLGRHMEQARVVSKATSQEEGKNMRLAQAISDNTSLKIQLDEAKSKAKRAEKIVNNTNMRDYIIKLFVVAEGFETDGVITEKAEELAKKYTKAAYQYLSKNVIAKILKDEANKLNEYLQMKEGE
jgi:hypothetical protein